MSTEDILAQIYTLGKRVKYDRFSGNGELILTEISHNENYNRICSYCGQECEKIHQKEPIMIRDLPICNKVSMIKVTQAKVACSKCGIVIEKLEYKEPYERYTNRFAEAVYGLSKVMCLSDVARFFGIDWKTARAITERRMLREIENRPEKEITSISIDEFAIKKGHKYATVIIDLSDGQILYLGKDRREETLDIYLKSLGKEKCQQIKVVSMDMWPAYRKAIKKRCKNAAIVYDKFHVVKKLNQAIDDLRRSEYSKANMSNKKLIKGSRYLLLKNTENLKEGQHEKLEKLRSLNENLNVAYILKDLLKEIWKKPSVGDARLALLDWVDKSQASGIKQLIKFGEMLLRFSKEITNYCIFNVSNAMIEGTNNKIKVMKRIAYGYRNFEYFSLKVMLING